MATRTCICSRNYKLLTSRAVSSWPMLIASPWRRHSSGAATARSLSTVTEAHVQHTTKKLQPVRRSKTYDQNSDSSMQALKPADKHYSATKALLRKNFSRLLMNHQPLVKGQPIDAATVYTEMAKLSTEEICDIVYVYLYKKQFYNRSKSVFLKAASYWPTETLEQFFADSGNRHVQFRLDLLNQVLIPRYRQTKDLNVLLPALPSATLPPSPASEPTTFLKNTLPLYNTALNATQKAKAFEHMEQIFQLMQERHIPLDAASYNIMIDAKLTNHRKSLLPREIYDGLLTKLFVPTQATFHIFLKHDIARQNWSHLNFWFETMEEYKMTPNQVTHRLLLKALAQYPHEPALLNLVDRLATMSPTPPTDDAKEQQPLPTLLLQDLPPDAKDVLVTAYKVSQQQPIYAFNLLLKYLCQNCHVNIARHVLDRMTRMKSLPEPDTVSFTTVFHGILRYKRNLDIRHVDSVREEMKQQGKHSSVLEAVAFYGTLKSNNYQNFKQALSTFDALVKDDSDKKNKTNSPQPPLDTMNIYNMMIDFYFNHYHKSEHLKERIPTEAFSLLNEATEQKGLVPNTSTLNIMIRGLALFHGDLIAADKLLNAFHEKGVEMNERTCWYLVSAAVRKGHSSAAMQYLQKYEKMGGSIQGSGLLDLKNALMKQ